MVEKSFSNQQNINKEIERFFTDSFEELKEFLGGQGPSKLLIYYQNEG